MPRRSKGPRLWLQPARKSAGGRTLERAVWVIRDGGIKRSTGAGQSEIAKAERALAAYLSQKITPRVRDANPAHVEIASVVTIYVEDVAAKHARPRETAARLGRILDHFGTKKLSYLNKKTCEEYVGARGHKAAAVSLRISAPPSVITGKQDCVPLSLQSCFPRKGRRANVGLPAPRRLV
jgi:hypothetical protein